MSIDRHRHLAIKLGQSHRFRGYELTPAERIELTGLDGRLGDVERAATIELRAGSRTSSEMAKFCGVSIAEADRVLEVLAQLGLARRIKHDGLPALWCEP